MAKKKEIEKEDVAEKEAAKEENVAAEDTPVEETVEEAPEPTELEKMTALAEDYKRKWYSVSAEYDNYRKRTATVSSASYASGMSDTLIKILPVADSFVYALDAADAKTKEGIEKIIKNFNAILESMGVTEIPIAPGDEFQEDVAEAVISVPCEEGESPHMVKQVLKKGYRTGEKVIRFAQVVVTVQ
ncbi:MAG: nucleotide exchange factor GrpE [Clostridia bacterium]|nr:nucleotide exchange factor GrpE [Clostridia bacterium]